MKQKLENSTFGPIPGRSRQEEEKHLADTLAIVRDNVADYTAQVRQMGAEIDEMLERYHDNDAEVLTLLNNTVTLHSHMKKTLERNERALHKPYFGRIDFCEEASGREEAIYIGRGGIAKDATHQVVADWRAPIANAYYENALGRCSYQAPGGEIAIDLKHKRTYEIENGQLLDFFDSEVIANDDLLTKYLSRSKQAVLGEIVATIQKEQNDIIRKTPFRNVIVQGGAGSGKTTVAMHRISYILYNYPERIKPDDFYIVGSNRILLNYITGVLPDLDVHGVRQMTMEQLFVRLLYEDWDDQKYHLRTGGPTSEPGNSQKSQSKNERDASQGNIKSSLSWFQDLEAYCDQLEWETISRESIFLNPRQFVEGFQDGQAGVFDRTGGRPAAPGERVRLIDGKNVERYILQNPLISIQGKINMLNQRLIGKVKEEFLKNPLRYTEAERKAILKAYRGRYGGRTWKKSIFDHYRDFLLDKRQDGLDVEIPDTVFDVYDLAALAYLYKRIKETDAICEARHIVIDEAQDFGMMAYCSLHYCIRGCAYTIMGDVSQNIHFGFGLNDWEELKALLLTDPADSFCVLKKSYRNTIEISHFATDILHHGSFPVYPVEPIIRHGAPVQVTAISAAAHANAAANTAKRQNNLFIRAADCIRGWQAKGLDTIAVICRNQKESELAAKELSPYVDIMESSLEKAVFGNGVMILPVEYTKGLEFDAVLILNPDRDAYPADNGHAKLLYVAATRALHELCILHTGNLTGLIADPLPEKKAPAAPSAASPAHSFPAQSGRPVAETASRQTISRQTALRRSDSRSPSRSLAAPGGRKAILDEKEAILAAKRKNPEPKPAAPAKASRLLPAAPAQETTRKAAAKSSSKLPTFGSEMPADQLRPAGHSPIDLAVRWVKKQEDGLHLQSCYGELRLSPVRGNMIRITFSRNGQISGDVHPGIAADRVERFWSYKDSPGMVCLTTDALRLQIDKATGSIQYMTPEGRLLLAERSKDSRQMEACADGSYRAWLYLNWLKKEQLRCPGPNDGEMLDLRETARYISSPTGQLPFVFSDKGCGILLASDSLAACCNLRPYGPYLYTEGINQLDYYFIFGKWQSTLLDAYSYLCKKQ